MMIKKGLMVLAACAAVTSVPAAAATDNPFVTDQVTLHLSGLDLSTVEGQQRLAIRMDNAARAVCGDDLSSIHLELGARARECRTAVLADIRAQIETRMAAAPEAARTQLAYNR